MDCGSCVLSVCPDECPNAKPKETVAICSECGEGVLEGEAHYRINEEVFCAFCVESGLCYG